MWASLRFPSLIVAIWLIEADGQPHAAPDVLDAGDEGGRHGPEADHEHAELAVGRLVSGPFDATKCRGSSAMPLSRARSSSGSCHCAGMRPVLAQCWTVLWLLSSSRASADCPPNRSMTCSAGFCLLVHAPHATKIYGSRSSTTAKQALPCPVIRVREASPVAVIPATERLHNRHYGEEPALVHTGAGTQRWGASSASLRMRWSGC